MRKHDVRKWLHAVLDLLPILVIPTFMIFSHRHDVTTDTVIVTPTPVYYQSNEVNSVDDFTVGNIYLFSFNDENYVGNTVSIGCDYLQLIDGNFNSYNYTVDYEVPYFDKVASTVTKILLTNENKGYLSGSYSFVFVYRSLERGNISDIISYISYTDIQILKEYVDVTTTIPNNVGTTLMNNFIDTSNEFFNFDNVFTFGDIHNWINTNIFGGNPPAVVGAIWNIIVYEFLMDMLFLFYALFMFLIDFIESLMERAFCKSNHGGVR